MTNDDLQQAVVEFHKLSLLPTSQQITYEQVKQYLIIHINDLLANDFAALVQLLYRMDIPEEKLRYFLQENKDEMASGIIAEMMIERQLQKAESRRLYSQQQDIPEDEKW